MLRNGYGHMVLDAYVHRLREMRAERTARLRALSTRREALAYQEHVRAAINDAFSPRPARTPLNARVTGTIDRSRCRIEKIVFESRPQFQVTANLYLPHTLEAPAPAVLGTCGHSAQGKAYHLYQGFCQRLAHAGFVALIYDPISQGERDQYTLLKDREAVESCTRAHNMMGKQLELLGDWFGIWRAWDGIRALDYLLSRPEVDPQRVGITGNSGGGTMTTWLWAIEERFTMAAPGCFVTTFLHNLENELPADCEQYPPGVLGAGLEMADFLIARAPLPVLILGQHYDYFDRRGHQEACDEVQHFYELLGAPEENVACFRGDQPHGYWRENQEAMVDFFVHHAGLDDVEHLDETKSLEEEALYATPQGDVIKAGSTPIYQLIAERADTLARQRSPLSDKALKSKLTELLHLPAERTLPHHRNLRPTESNGETYARYAIETEGSIRAILRKKMDEPRRAHSLDVEETIHLFLPHYASEKDLREDPLARALTDDMPLYALDVRGLGESRPDEEESFWQPYGMDYMLHGYSLLFGESYLGRRVLDVLQTMDLLVNQGAHEIHLYGRGQGALIALFSALLHGRTTTVTLKNIPKSYHEWTQVSLVDWPAANGLHDVLQYFDLEDCIEVLGDKVTIIEPWDATMSPKATE
ncbi:MAG: alpha/beta hydrolase family protein [Anaerolineales bacterium]